MGGKQSRPVIEYADAIKVLPRGDLQVLQAMFSRLADSPDQRGGIPRERFIEEVLAPRFTRCSSAVLQRVFQVIDCNGTGLVEFEEFISAMYVLLHGYREDRLRLVFNCFDLDGNGTVSKKELRKMSVALLQPKDAPGDWESKNKDIAPLADALVALSVQNFDRDRDEALGWGEWRRYAEDDEAIQRLLDDMTRVRLPAKDLETCIAALQRKQEQDAAAGRTPQRYYFNLAPKQPPAGGAASAAPVAAAAAATAAAAAAAASSMGDGGRPEDGDL